MKKIIDSKKRFYNCPTIQLVTLDSTISLQLESAPPAGPNEQSYNSDTPAYLQSNPFKLLG